MLATRYGVHAIDLVHQGKFGCMVSLKGNDIRSVPIADAIARTRYVSQELIDVAASLNEYQPEGVYKS
jgi:6-phosphofructokinase 1